MQCKVCGSRCEFGISGSRRGMMARQAKTRRRQGMARGEDGKARRGDGKPEEGKGRQDREDSLGGGGGKTRQDMAR